MTTNYDLSGILSLATRVNQTNNSNKVAYKSLFGIDQYGSIMVNSFTDKKYAGMAKACDTNRNGKLQLGEIFKFLSNQSIKKNDIKTGQNRLVYYQETDLKGNITKRAYYGKGDKSQYVYTYNKDGKPLRCEELSSDGSTSSYDLVNGRMEIKDSSGAYKATMPASVLKNKISIGKSVYNEDEPTSFFSKWF